jgi:SAM-dependent methyltransferase
LGCGPNPKNIFNASEVHGVDLFSDPAKNIVAADLAVEPIPFPDGHFHFVTAHDFIEHVPRILYLPQRRNPFVEVMNEIWRVLVPGGRFYSQTPAYPEAAAFWDPTHVNIITEQTFPCYFDDQNTWAKMYGFKGAFTIENQVWQKPHLVTMMKKTSPKP